MKKIIIISLLIILIPYIVVTLFIYDEKIKFYFKNSKQIRIQNEKGEITKIPFEEYIVGVVASEMPASFEIEALKAQAVAARSYAHIQMKQNADKNYDVVDTVMNQVYNNEEKLKEKWKEKYEEKINKVRKAVIDTKGEYVTYQGEIIEALFFSTSSGKTENVEEVFHESLPYLKSVDSSFDKEVSPVYEDQKIFLKNDFCTKLKLQTCTSILVEIQSQTGTGRIQKIKINNQIFTGQDITNKLTLRSANFSIVEENDQVIIKTKGYGHGVGMSQYGAEALAKRGYDYQKILKHYYTGVEIKKI